ncbi:MAG TPA: LCP family protein [Catenuloplanes sp.]
MTSPGTPLRRRRMIWGAAIAAAVLLLAGGTFVVTKLVRARYAVPTADLFTPGPSAPGESAAPSAEPSPPPGEGITGPLNVLIVGVDTRVNNPGWQPHADAVLILHVTAGLDKAYLTSLPRDLLVDAPAFGPARFDGGRLKLTESMAYGSRVPGGNQAKPEQGFQLVAATVSRYTGIKRFDAGAMLTFGGFDKLVDTMGGVELTIDQRVASIHRRPDGTHREGNPSGPGYVGPQMVYEPGLRKLTGWQALDYARQRYLSGGDYTRQRHQRQLLKALIQQAVSSGLAGDPARLDATLRALGRTLVFDGRGRTPIDYAYALRDLKPEAVTLVGLPGAGVGRGGDYQGEQLTAPGRKYLTELAAGRVEAYVNAHPEVVDKR